MICDPWLEGSAFDDSWALLAKTTFSYGDFQHITHIWFSHEHPDHFSPPNLRKIAPEHRQKITVLFQQTRDKRVVDFLEKLQFKEVIELEPDRWYPLGAGVDVLCNPAEGFEDSWLCLRAPTGKLLNLNDCWIVDRTMLEDIRQKVGDIDLLATQFSISAWDGNPEEADRRRQGARTMLDKAIIQCEVLRPRYVLPFASFIWFCHEENAYMNSAFLGLDEVVATLAQQATPILLYPGDPWTLGAPFDPKPALAKYAAEQAGLPQRARVQPQFVPQAALIEQSRKFCEELLAGSDRSRARVTWAAQSFRRNGRNGGSPGGLGNRLRRLARLARLEVEPAWIYVTDHQASYAFYPETGLVPVDRPRAGCDLEVSSAALHYAFKFLWGGQTLHINGRFREVRRQSREMMFYYFNMARDRIGGNVMRWSTLPKDVARKVVGNVASKGE